MEAKRFFAALAGALLLAAAASAGPLVANSGFETPPFPGWPGYSSSIPGWSGAGGVNPTDIGQAPFLNGLAAPEGTHVGFIQNNGTTSRSISQSVSGFVVGADYVVGYLENERTGADRIARLQVDLGGQTVVPAHSVVRTPQFRQIVSQPFTATSASHLLEVIHPGHGVGDNTALFDSFIVTRAGVDNPSFEEGPVNPWPGYGPINDWVRTHPPGNSGTNNASGPFTNGLPIPDGDWIAFIQGGGRVSQTVGGFEPGRQYLAQYFENERTGADRIARLQVDLGGQTVVAAHDVTRTPQFRTVVSDPFTATSFTHLLEVIHPGGGTGDNTALFDNVLVTPADVPFIKNANFEDGPVHAWPGYGRINSWHSTGTRGTNDATGPFVNGLPIPDGEWAGFIQRTGSVSQTVVGLTPGKDYIVQYSENERYAGAATIARLEVKLDGQTVVPVHNIDRTPVFRQVAGTPFTATSRSALLEVIHPGGGLGDNTVLFDNFIITEAGVPFIKNPGFEQTPNGYGGSGAYYSDVPQWSDPVGPNAGVATRSPHYTATWLGGAEPPEGDQAGFIQGSGTISQLVVGLEAGKEYILQYAENERGFAGGGPPTARLQVNLGGQTIVPAHAVTNTGEFRQVAGAPFTATSHAHLLEVIHPGGGAGDNTALFDAFLITEAGVPHTKNPSFEEGPVHAWPGYGLVKGWTREHPPGGNSGTNDISGPFLNRLPIPDGDWIGFIQRGGTVSQLVVGLEPGQEYLLQFQENERGLSGAVARLQVDMAGRTIVPDHTITRTGQFRQVVSSPFRATSHAQLLEVIHPGGGVGDNTALFDDFVITPVGAPYVYNPSFEKGPLNPYPGYGPITGWARTHLGGNSGTNDASGPFVNGLPIPDGGRVGFVQRAGTLSETVVGLLPGREYTLQFFANERGYDGGGAWDAVAQLRVQMDGQTVVAPLDLRRTDRFRRVVSASFTASSMTALLALSNLNGSVDNTLLLDNLFVTRAVPVLANGGFEEPRLGPGAFQYRPVTGDWLFTGGSGMSRNRSGFQDGPAGDALEGSQIAFLQGGSPQNPTRVEQTFGGFEVGAWYSLTWLEMKRPNYSGNDLLVELIDPTGKAKKLFYDDEIDSAIWEMVTSQPFMAQFDSYALRFSTTNPFGGDRTTFIDDVHFNFEAEIPEPTTLALLGLGGLALLRRRRRVPRRQ